MVLSTISWKALDGSWSLKAFQTDAEAVSRPFEFTFVGGTTHDDVIAAFCEVFGDLAPYLVEHSRDGASHLQLSVAQLRDRDIEAVVHVNN